MKNRRMSKKDEQEVTLQDEQGQKEEKVGYYDYKMKRSRRRIKLRLEDEEKTRRGGRENEITR